MNALGRIARGVAKVRMKKAGVRQICKKKYIKNDDKGISGCSYFSKHWKEYVKK